MKTQLAIVFLFFSIVKGYAQEKHYWTSYSNTSVIPLKKISNKTDYLINYNLLKLDINHLKMNLDMGLQSRNKGSIKIKIPTSSESFEEFKVVESSIMHPELQRKYPSIRTFKGVGLTDPTATIRFSIGPLGFHALSSSGKRSTLYIEPFEKNQTVHMVYMRNAIRDVDSDFMCSVETENKQFARHEKSSKTAANTDINDQKLRKYRLALSCTGEYAQIFAGTGTEIEQKTNVLAAMVTSVNRVNEIYERDFGIRLELVANNDAVIYLDGTTDPWDNEFNTTTAVTLDDVIGVDNYDIGHNYNDTGGGNAGCLGCVCAAESQNNFHKGRGWTGSGNPVGDPFYIDYVAHEMGHQFYGFHTMNVCSRSGYNTEVEPGSGSSIMGYAGICAPNVQNNSDAHFNYVNVRDVGGFIKTGYNPYYDVTVPSCSEEITIQNQSPTADAGIDFTIPTNTPFVLNGTGYDPDRLDTLTFNWSQNDPEQGPSNNTPQSSWVNGPLYRSLLPSITPIRYFPKLETVVGGNLSSTWEVTPSVARTLNFALTVRDNGSGFVGDDGTGQVATDEMVVTVIETGSSFSVTSQNTPNLMWESGSTQTVSWDVAGTDANGINASEVDIVLSTNGGETFNEILAQGVPNNGTYDITVPNIPSISCRVMVRGSNHIFYAVNNTSFTIDYLVETNCVTYSSAENLGLNIPDGEGAEVPGDFLVQYVDIVDDNLIDDLNFNIDISHTYISDLQIILQHPDGTQAIVFSRNCSDQNNLDITFDDEAASAIVCGEPIQGTFRPSDTSLAVFDGKSALGSWVIGIRDFYNEDPGVLNDYSLEICSTVITNNDVTSPVVTINQGSEIYLLGSDYVEVGATAVDDTDGDITNAITIDTTNLPNDGLAMDVTGDFDVVYSVDDAAGNTGQAARTISVIDTVAPELELLGDSIIEIDVFSTYEEPGYTATDNYDANPQISVTGSVDTSLLGGYTLTYIATDASGNESTPKYRTVVVKDNEAPVITIVGENPYEISQGDAYIELGANAIDNYDSTVTVNISGNVDNSQPGEYVRTYTASDSSGNTSTESRTVIVNEVLYVLTQEQLNVIKVYPNPVKHTLIINTAIDNLRFKIFDINGRPVLSSRSKTIPLNNISNGAYILEITGNNLKSYKHIIKE